MNVSSPLITARGGESRAFGRPHALSARAARGCSNRPRTAAAASAPVRGSIAGPSDARSAEPRPGSVRCRRCRRRSARRRWCAANMSLPRTNALHLAHRGAPTAATPPCRDRARPGPPTRCVHLGFAPDGAHADPASHWAGPYGPRSREARWELPAALARRRSSGRPTRRPDTSRVCLHPEQLAPRNGGRQHRTEQREVVLDGRRGGRHGRPGGRIAQADLSDAVGDDLRDPVGLIVAHQGEGGDERRIVELGGREGESELRPRAVDEQQRGLIAKALAPQRRAVLRGVVTTR